MPESGLVAVTVFGVVLANIGVAGLGNLTRIKEALVILIVSALFIVLASDLDAEVLARLSLPLLAVTAAVVFLVRPAAIMLATIGSGMTWQERVLVSWIGPRGIVAAAVAGLASIKLSADAYPSSELLQPAVFAVITATVFLHGFTLRHLARWLGLVSQVRPSIAIIGASPWSIDLARALRDFDVLVTMVDTFAEPLKAARSQGLEVLLIEALAERGEEVLGRQRHDYVLAATPDEIYNALICAKLAPEIGRERVVQIAAGDGRLLDKRRGFSRDLRGKVWVEATLDYRSLEERHGAGWRIQRVPVEEGEGAAELPSSPSIVPAVIVRADGSLFLVSPEGTSGPAVSAGDNIHRIRIARPWATRRKFMRSHASLDRPGRDCWRINQSKESSGQAGSGDTAIDPLPCPSSDPSLAAARLTASRTAQGRASPSRGNGAASDGRP